MTGMMAQTGSLGQPLLIPLSMAGSIGGQGGLAVLTLPTTNVTTLPGLAAANAAGNLLKLPFAGLQGKAKSACPCVHPVWSVLFGLYHILFIYITFDTEGESQ